MHSLRSLWNRLISIGHNGWRRSRKRCNRIEISSWCVYHITLHHRIRSTHYTVHRTYIESLGVFFDSRVDSRSVWMQWDELKYVWRNLFIQCSNVTIAAIRFSPTLNIIWISYMHWTLNNEPIYVEDEERKDKPCHRHSHLITPTLVGVVFRHLLTRRVVGGRCLSQKVSKLVT